MSVKLVVEHLAHVPLETPLVIEAKVVKCTKSFGFTEVKIVNPESQETIVKGQHLVAFINRMANL